MGKRSKIDPVSSDHHLLNNNSLSKEGPSIALKGSIPLSLAFHPAQDFLAVSTITGEVRCYEYTNQSAKRLFSSKHHKDSVRCVKFSQGGAHLYSCSVDKSMQVLDMETRQIIQKKSKAHDRAINTLLPLNETLVASGDDSGQVRVWDLRTKSVVQQWQEHKDDAVTDLHWVPHKKTLVSIGADGYLSVYDIRKANVIARSDNMETELQCMVSVKGGTRMAVGQGDGAISIWKWGWWGDMIDRFPGHPGSIDAMVALADDLIVTGSSDGIVRVLSVLPNKLLGVIGSHDEFPIENLSVSHDRRWLASSSHDMTVRMWNLSFLDDNGSDEEQIPMDAELSDVSHQSEVSWVSVDDDDDDDHDHVNGDDNSSIDIEGSDEPSSLLLSCNVTEDVDEDDLELRHALLAIDAGDSSGALEPNSLFIASDEESAMVHIDSDSDEGDPSTSKARKRKKKRQKQAQVFQAKKPKSGTSMNSFFSGL